MRVPGALSHQCRKSGHLNLATMQDEYDGQGGSYLLNPKTGKRKLIERTEPAPQPMNEAASNGTAEPQTPDSDQD